VTHSVGNLDEDPDAPRHPERMAVLRRIRQQPGVDEGFTLIELLVLMIIIGILAAIAIPVFPNQRAKARSSSVKADVTNLGKEIITYYIDHTGTIYATSPAAGAWALGTTNGGNDVATGKLSPGNTVVDQAITSPTSICVAVQNTDAGPTNAWMYT
jgi:type IV pilus assembly protein PilA